MAEQIRRCLKASCPNTFTCDDKSSKVYCHPDHDPLAPQKKKEWADGEDVANIVRKKPAVEVKQKVEAIVRAGLDLGLRGSQIAKRLNDAGFKTVSGAAWKMANASAVAYRLRKRKEGS